MSLLTASDPRTYAIIGAAMEVHRQLGCGFLKPVYQEALRIELASRAIPFESKRQFPVIYKGCRLDGFYKPDFICYEEVVVELKALARLSSSEESQVINYLKSHRAAHRITHQLRKSEFGTTTVCFDLKRLSTDCAEYTDI